jgi:nucleotide-binding universal stress UspA family protein
MRPIRKLLVPVDFSPDSAAVLDWAIGFARKLGAEIDLLHSYEIPPLDTLYGVGFPGSLDDELRRAAKTQLSELAHHVASEGIHVREHVVRDPPAEAIVEHAEKLGADLIVMGSRGRSGLAHVLLGSVAERTIQRAPCPVLAVKYAEGGSPGPQSRPESSSAPPRRSSRR